VTVTGKVIFKEDNSEAPGVNVVEKETKNGTQTGSDGTFKLEVTDLNAVLVFSFIGVRTQEVNVNGKTQLLVKLKLDCTKDFFDSNEIHMYASSGVINNPIGGQVDIASPWTFLGVIKGSYSYQTNLDENKMQTAQVKLMHSISNCDFDMDFRWGHRQVAFDGNVNFNSNSIETDFNLRNVIAGYSHLTFAQREQNQEKTNGFVIGVGRSFNIPLYPTAIIKFSVYRDKLEYSASIQGGHKRLLCFLKFYKLDAFNELSLGIGTAFGYRTTKRQRQIP
jgi:hypothetical protein